MEVFNLSLRVNYGKHGFNHFLLVLFLWVLVPPNSYQFYYY